MVEFAENLNPETFNRVLNELLEQGVSRRVAEGRARRVAMVEYNREHGEEAAAPAAALTAPPPTGKVPAPKPGVPDKHRLLALVPPEGVQRVEREQGDRVNTFPHLLIQELLSLIIVTAALIVFSTFVNAPLRELANPNLTPNPSKAPWYFLGLQELLRYFHPMVAGAIVLFTMLLMFFMILTIIGAFFRGPGFNFVWPWSDGVFFDL